MNNNPIRVNQPAMPPLNEFIPYLERIWANKTLTNCGPIHGELEDALCEFLDVEYVSLFANGTLALMTALQSLNLKGDVITTPYSFVATSHALQWNNLEPVFVDVDPKTLNLDPAKVEKAITERTSAILPVHCYGNPCDVVRLNEIAKTRNLKLIYDAAHAFGVNCSEGSSLLRHGDLSVLSFHATKAFSTFEGGAVVSGDAETKRRIDQLKNFAFIDEVSVVEVGLNGKMAEINAAFGLLQLRYFKRELSRRREIDLMYRELLQPVEGVVCLEPGTNNTSNFSYFPIFVTQKYHLTRDELMEKLVKHNIHARRYFYPLISSFDRYSSLPSSEIDKLPVAHSAAAAVLCLPIHSNLTDKAINEIVTVIAGDR